MNKEQRYNKYGKFETDVVLPLAGTRLKLSICNFVHSRLCITMHATCV